MLSCFAVCFFINLFIASLDCLGEIKFDMFPIACLYVNPPICLTIVACLCLSFARPSLCRQTLTPHGNTQLNFPVTNLLIPLTAMLMKTKVATVTEAGMTQASGQILAHLALTLAPLQTTKTRTLDPASGQTQSPTGMAMFQTFLVPATIRARQDPAMALHLLPTVSTPATALGPIQTLLVMALTQAFQATALTLVLVTT